MHGMIGMTELLLHTDLSEQQKRFARAAHTSGESLLALMSDILDFSKIEASKVELERVQFDLIEVIDQVCYIQAEPAQRRSLELNTICDDSVPELLVGDPTKIRQVVMNLVNNSIKFTHEGRVDIRVSGRPNTDDASLAEINISVRDTGIGMNEDTQQRVFEAFTQADASTTRQYGGTGLGLAISKKFIDLMGGDIKIESEVGVGTTFSITIPLEIVDNKLSAPKQFEGYNANLICDNPATIEMLSSHLSRLGITAKPNFNHETSMEPTSPSTITIIDSAVVEKHPEVARFLDARSIARGIVLTPLTAVDKKPDIDGWLRLYKPVTSSALREAVSDLLLNTQVNESFIGKKKPGGTTNKPNVLVAEDVATNQKIISEILKMLGCLVDIASNGNDALDKFLGGKYDLIFMDCQMPIMDGYTATSRIREIELENNLDALPIIALTAGTTQEAQDRCKEAGMNGHLAKPFTIADISRSLSEFIEFKSADSSGVLANPNPKEIQKDHRLTDHEKVDVINMRSVENILEVERQTGKNIISEIIDGFDSQMHQKLVELQSQKDSLNHEAFYKTAHAIKSMSASVGADRVRSISAELEKIGKLGELDDVDTLILELHNAFHEFNSEFEAVIGNRIGVLAKLTEELQKGRTSMAASKHTRQPHAYPSMLRYSDKIQISLVVIVCVTAFLMMTPYSRAALSIRVVDSIIDSASGKQPILKIHSTEDGLLWFAKQEGVSLFDGASLRQYVRGKSGPGSIPSTSITKIIEGPEGQLLIATDDVGLLLYNSELDFFSRFRWTDSKDITASDLSSALYDTSGRIWVGHSSGQISQIQTKQQRAILYPLAESERIADITESEAGVLFAASANGHIYRYDSEKTYLNL